MEEQCPFCNVSLDRIIFADQKLYALWDNYPVSPGHALIVPRKHITDWFHATDEIRHLLISAIQDVKVEIEKLHRPDGYNVGFNAGAAAGQTVNHLHVHVIPRYVGDVNDPRGGVRHVIPAKAKYLVKEKAVDYVPATTTPDLQLNTGEATPLLPHIRKDIARAIRVDIAVAFTQCGLDTE